MSIPNNEQKPVAYDEQGRPLYLHPSINAQPQVVHMARSANPVKIPLSDEVKKKHEASKIRYPNLNISDGEYVISAVRRHPIGIVFIVGSATVFIAMIITMWVLAFANPLVPAFAIEPAAAPAAHLLAFLTCVLTLLIAWAAVVIYRGNKFYLTNESVIQELQTSLISRQEQTVSLDNIEDASFTQKTILQQIFNYGSIRLSTEGDETTYQFSYVSNPKQQISILNNAVEAFKNGRPID